MTDLGRQLRLARLQLPLPLRHAPQPLVERIQLAVSLGAGGQQRLLLVSKRTLLGCKGTEGRRAVWSRELACIAGAAALWT